MKVVMLDAGLRLEPEKEAAARRLESGSRSDWSAQDLAALKSPLRADRSGVPLKFVFGSDFAFRVPPPAPRLEFDGTRALRSYARGGLSNAWGATFLPFTQDDVSDWPIGIADLAPHYEAVMKDVPLSAAADDLSELFPLYTDRAAPLRPAEQARRLLERFADNRAALRARGFVFGQARLAARAAAGEGGEKACVYCGLCLYGCPYGSIYCSTETLAELLKHPRFEYRSGVVARRAVENAGGVRLECRSVSGEEDSVHEASRAYLAGGALSTSMILAESLGLKDAALPVRCSQSFLMPLLLSRPVDGAAREELNTLCQVFLSLKDPAVSRRLVQLQVYTYNDLMPSVLRASAAGPLFRAFPGLEARALSRLVVMQGLLHSDDSDPLSLKIAGEGRYVLSGAVSGAVRAAVARIGRKLMSARRELGFLPLTPLTKISSPGQSYHSGSTFPMSANPGPLETDVWGRPRGLQRLHAVDATVLPSIPAPTFTFTVMANAHRIASHAW
jgi:choline dehydrogenase-like flavoprotein